MTQLALFRPSRLTLAVAMLLTGVPAFAQSTTSAVDGQVLSASGAPLAGVQVTIVHEPSGTVRHATTDTHGRYLVNGLRVGGPYKVEVTQDGQTGTRDALYLGLAQRQEIDLHLGTTDLAAVEVTGTAPSVFSHDNKGLGTVINSAQLRTIPNSDRSIQNIARVDPRISITDRDAGAISANGKNFRYNCITVDDVNAGDPFGLEANGLGSIGSPISQDAIASYNLSTANFDVSQRGCVGANINAVTKSGTNALHGSLYYGYRTANDAFMGKITPIGGSKALPYAGWQREWTSGFTVGGPLIQDKLFFFANYEHSNRVGIGPVSAPSDSNASATLVNGVDTAFFNAVLAQAETVGLHPGDRTLPNLTDDRYLAKIDWNINDHQRAVFRVNETKESQPVPTGSASTVTPTSNWYLRDRDTKSGIAQLFSDWTDTFSTEADLSFSHSTQVRGPLDGIEQPAVVVTVSPVSLVPNVTLGTEFSSQDNAVDVKSLNGAFAGTWHLGDHALKAGVTEIQDTVSNNFIQNFNGSYAYLGLANFQAGRWAEYTIRLPSPGLSLNQATADFKKQQFGGFIQDTWQLSDQLSVQYGLRYDVPEFPSKPLFNPCFAAAPGTPVTAHAADGSTTCTAPKGGFGYANNSTPSGNGTWQPRLSFNYQFDTQRKTQLRGGVGVFASDVPTVWYAGAFGNNGISQTTYDIQDVLSTPAGTLLCSANGKTFLPAALLGGHCLPGMVSYTKQGPVYNASAPLIPGSGPLVLGSNLAQMSVDTIDPNFKMPSTTQVALAFDRELPWMGLIGSAEFNYTKTNDDIFYKSLNLGAPTYTGPDGRAYFCDPTKLAACSSFTRAGANPAFGTVTELSNTHHGASDTLTLSLNKPMTESWAGMVALRFGHSTDVNSGTSSVASSTIANSIVFNPNTNTASTSNYSVPVRALASVTWQHHFFSSYLTSVSLFGDMHSGAPYSWISGTDTNGDGNINDLVYVPKSATDVEWAPSVTDAQKQQFMSFINGNSYLRSHEGTSVGRNGTHAAWLNQFDMSFTQEIPGFTTSQKGEVRFDVFNLGNLLKSTWGVERRAPYPLARNLANVSGVDPATGKYIYDISGSAYKDAHGNYVPGSYVINEGQTLGVPVPSQRWSVMMTLRYTF